MDKEFLGQRRRALEEEYFAKLNRALLERLRAIEAPDAKVGPAYERADSDASLDQGFDGAPLTFATARSRG